MPRLNSDDAAIAAAGLLGSALALLLAIAFAVAGPPGARRVRDVSIEEVSTELGPMLVYVYELDGAEGRAYVRPGDLEEFREYLRGGRCP